MTYLLLGYEALEKDQFLSQLKQKYISSPGAEQFDYDVLHASKLDADTLKQSLLGLPAMGMHRVVLIRAAEKLNQRNKDLLLEVLAEKPKALIVIIEATALDGKTTFYKKISKLAEVKRFGVDEKGNVFDITNAMERHKTDEALRALHRIMDEGQHPLQIMGVLIWFWNKMKKRVGRDVFKKGLLELQEADLNIKRSRLQPDYAMEVVVTKLCSLIAC